MAELSSGDLNTGENPVHQGQAKGVIELLSEPDPFLSVGDPFLEPSPLW